MFFNLRCVFVSLEFLPWNESHSLLLIHKDWKDYASLFVDKAKFQNFFDLINQYRADAHAKELDEEEEAMLNIAFRYFEKALRDL